MKKVLLHRKVRKLTHRAPRSPVVSTHYHSVHSNMTLEVSVFADSIDLVSRMPAKKLTKKIHLHFVTCPGVHNVLFIWERCTAGLEKRSSRKSPPKGGIFFTPTINCFCAHATQCLMPMSVPRILPCTFMRSGNQENHLPRGNIFHPNYICFCDHAAKWIISFSFFSPYFAD